jgi:NAD(P)-dependent dehydrogenase (short-subunit alcohol dehydrogenase family)
MTKPQGAGAVVAVVGASGTMGAAVCRELARRGARLLLVGRSLSRLRAAELPEAPTVLADVTDAACGDRIIEGAATHYGRLDGLVNAAYLMSADPLRQLPDEVLEEVFLVNAIGPLFLVKRILPVLPRPGGLIVSLTVGMPEPAAPEQAGYAAAAAGLRAAIGALAAAVRDEGIQVLDVEAPPVGCPPMGPPMGPPMTPEDLAQQIADAIEQDRQRLRPADFRRA